ncbi:MAG TPA: sugar-binding domain-containing protein, partial [Burkholderiales bacterium]|nr:sugar-binding domain-containing protein [Burkholderiales bacterium]
MNNELNTRVAWLYYMENFTQAAIGDRLGLTRAHVNRILSEARETGLVRITVNSNFAHCAALEQRLKESCGVRDAVVIPTPEDIELLPALLGMAAGEYLSRFLEANRPTVVGVGWGATIRETIRHVRVARYPDLWITSMMGGLSQGLELNTFEIAGELAKRLQARCSYLAAPIYTSSAR